MRRGRRGWLHPAAGSQVREIHFLRTARCQPLRVFASKIENGQKIIGSENINLSFLTLFVFFLFYFFLDFIFSQNNIIQFNVIFYYLRSII